MLDIVLYDIQLFLDVKYLLVNDFRVELGNLPDRFLHKFQDVVHGYLADELTLELAHSLEYVLDLRFPGLLVLFQDLVHPVLEEDFFEGGVVPAVFKFVLLDFQLFLQQVAGVFRVVDENVVHAEELRFVVLDDAGVRGNVRFAIREGIECIYCLVRGNVIRKMDDKICRVGSHIFDLLDFYLALVLGFQYGIDQNVGCLAVRYLLDGQSVLVYFLNLRPDFHASAALSLHVFGAIGVASGREIRQQLEFFSLEVCYGSVDKFIEVVRQYLGCHTDSDALGALCKQERESYRQLHRLLVPSVV